MEHSEKWVESTIAKLISTCSFEKLLKKYMHDGLQPLHFCKLVILNLFCSNCPDKSYKACPQENASMPKMPTSVHNLKDF